MKRPFAAMLAALVVFALGTSCARPASSTPTVEPALADPIETEY